MPVLTCVICGKQYFRDNKRHVTCSYTCGAKYRNLRQINENLRNEIVRQGKPTPISKSDVFDIAMTIMGDVTTPCAKRAITATMKSLGYGYDVKKPTKYTPYVLAGQ